MVARSQETSDPLCVPDFTGKPTFNTLGTLSIFHEPEMPRENTDSATPR